MVNVQQEAPSRMDPVVAIPGGRVSSGWWYYAFDSTGEARLPA